MKVVYKVMVRIRAGYDDTMDAEYNNRLVLAYIDRIEVY